MRRSLARSADRNGEQGERNGVRNDARDVQNDVRHAARGAQSDVKIGATAPPKTKSNIQKEVPVPEPSTWTMMILGFAGIEASSDGCVICR